MSMPISAAGTSPTAESTLNRPPTFSGIPNVRYPSDCARANRSPLPSVVAATIRAAAPAPSACCIHSRTSIKVDTVSAVPPLLAITTTSVFRGSMDARAACVKSGSTLSRITSRGCSGVKAP